MDLNRIVSFTLRLGVLASAVLGAFGLLIWGITGFSENLDTAYSNFIAIILSAIQGNTVGLVYLAVIILLATPVARIVLSSVYFIRIRDRQYTTITLVVLAMILFAIFLLPR
jgi:uncharacterized membrane protein